jgi:hypothetical protein
VGTANSSFLVMNVASATTPTLTRTAVAPNTKIPGGIAELNDTYVWSSVNLQRSSLGVTLNSTRHPGDGQVVVAFDPHSAVVSYKLAGVAQTTSPASGSRRITVPFSTPSTGNLTLTLPGGSHNVGDISVQIPKSATDVLLSLNAPAASAGFDFCSDPSSSSVACSPDPLVTQGSRSDIWQPWANILGTDPTAVPQEVADRAGVTLTASLCAGPTPTLATAIDELASAMGQNDSMSSGLSIGAQAANALAALVHCVAAQIPHLPAFDPTASGLPGSTLRGQWLTSMRDLMTALRDFPAVALPAAAGVPVCIDVLCLIQTGGVDATQYTANAAVVVDEGGDDTYTNNAAGARPTLPVAVLLDQGPGNDKYLPAVTDLWGGAGTASGPHLGHPTNGSGAGGAVGVLVDEGGNDHYCGLGNTMGAAYAGGGYLLDESGDDFYESFDPDNPSNGTCIQSVYPQANHGTSQKIDHGAAQAGGFGFLVDQSGNDRYQNDGVDSLGWGGLAGIGLLRDDQGNDQYTVRPAYNVPGDPTGAFPPHIASGVSIGTGEFGGTGVLLDGGGLDSYACTGSMNYGCIGGSLEGGLGLVYDTGIDSDSFQLPQQLALYGGTTSIGYPAGIGASAYAGLGMLVKRGPSVRDTYSCPNRACGGFAYLGTGLFVGDGGGDDCVGFTSIPMAPAGARRCSSEFWIGEAPNDVGLIGGSGVNRAV